MARLAGRRDMRADITRYESMAVMLVNPSDLAPGEAISMYPPIESPLHFDGFFERIFEQYDLRFVYGAPNIARETRRLEWDPDSPALQHDCAAGLTPRLASASGMSDDSEEASDEAANASLFD